MNHHENMTPEQAELITGLAAQLIDVMAKTGHANPDLHWLNMVSAAAVACRGIAATAMAADPRLPLDKARQQMIMEFIQVMALPAELVRIVKTPNVEGAQTVVLPVRRH